MQSAALNSPTYTDFGGLNTLRAQARVDPQASLQQVAKQFEGIFIQMMLKSMRAASLGDDIFDSDQSKLYRDMFDKQIALDMASSKGIGIAESLVRQLSKNSPEKNKIDIFRVDKNKDPISAQSGKSLPLTVNKVELELDTFDNDLERLELTMTQFVDDKRTFNSAEEFTQYVLPFAEKAADALGVSPMVLVSQAALETGWGKAVIRRPDGSSSFNLFNIKADTRWNGEKVIKSTLEYENGLAKYEKASFRAYDSYADSFDDYVDFLRENTRYHSALQHQGNDKLFIKGLHQAGYATDPNYADKVISIFNRETIKDRLSTEFNHRGVDNGHV